MPRKSVVRSNGAPNPRQQALINLMIDGCTVDVAAEALKVRRSYINEALRDPLIKAELAAARDARRASAQPEAVDKLIHTMRQSGEGTTADRRLQLDAARAILGEDAKAPVVNVGVQVNNQVNATFRPGYVLKLPPGVEPPTIEGQADETTQQG